MAVLEVKNIKKSFGKTEVLKGISFSMEKGEVLAIIGSSGSGKTTLLRCLNFLETPDSGTIEVNGELLLDASKLTRRQIKRPNETETRKKRLHFGLVFQSFNLFPQYNVLKNVTLAMDLRDSSNGQKHSKENIDKARALIARVGLSEKEKNYPCELSGGQQQRVAIARALALNPDILCFDEPTSALDPELTGEVLRVIRGLKGGDNTMIVVTHEMEFARNIADKIIYMADGVIEEEGTPEEVFEHPKSHRTKSFLSSGKNSVVGEIKERKGCSKDIEELLQKSDELLSKPNLVDVR